MREARPCSTFPCPGDSAAGDCPGPTAPLRHGSTTHSAGIVDRKHVDVPVEHQPSDHRRTSGINATRSGIVSSLVRSVYQAPIEKAHIIHCRTRIARGIGRARAHEVLQERHILPRSSSMAFSRWSMTVDPRRCRMVRVVPVAQSSLCLHIRIRLHQGVRRSQRRLRVSIRSAPPHVRAARARLPCGRGRYRTDAAHVCSSLRRWTFRACAQAPR